MLVQNYSQHMEVVDIDLQSFSEGALDLLISIIIIIQSDHDVNATTVQDLILIVLLSHC